MYKEKSRKKKDKFCNVQSGFRVCIPNFFFFSFNLKKLRAGEILAIKSKEFNRYFEKSKILYNMQKN